MVNIRDLDPSASPVDYYGAELRRYREAVGMTQKQLGSKIFCTGSLVGQIETARKIPTPEFSQQADAALKTGGALTRLLGLVLRHQLPVWFHDYIDREARATHLYAFQPVLVHGLLQTEEYARVVMGVLTEEGLDEKVAARMERHRILKREQPPLVWMVLSETALYQAIGGASVMRNQLAHLLSFRNRSAVSIQVLPFDAGAHAGFSGAFTILRFSNEADVAYNQDYDLGHLTANAQSVRDRSLRYARLQAAALSVEDSAELIARVMEERYGEHL
ncbi:helix-turn-helix transcriptional regulator [Streptomyces sp. NPDC051776]|uniref:helix-turn-helix domain-containing protein n=1 Tax=Streptomyces sp. NPDC051776 TaxID=3155414 RepID=UPI0034439256